MGYEDDLNLYAYVYNDPINKTDPTGECESISTCAMMRDDIAVGSGEMTQEEHRERAQARAVGAAVGAAAVAVAIGGTEIVVVASAGYRTVRFERRIAQARELLKGFKETPARAGADKGRRFEDPSDTGNRVRIDKGDPDSPFPGQRVDHVRVNKGGKVRDSEGKEIKPTPEQPKPRKTEEAHIPWVEWIKKPFD